MTLLQDGSHTDHTIYIKAANSNEVETKDGYKLEGSLLVLQHAARANAGMYRVTYAPEVSRQDATMELILKTGMQSLANLSLLQLLVRK